MDSWYILSAHLEDTYHAWRGDKGAGTYDDIPGFRKSAAMEEIRRHGHILTPGRYVGAEAAEEDDEAFPDKMQRLWASLEAQFAEGARLEQAIRRNLRKLGYGT